ncbi:MAG: thioredoxin [Lachnospiraceae bacterium]|nr:thioredoxin [Lachnospiraceae bacterium]
MGSRSKCFARIIIAGIACGFIVYGTARGEVEIVLNKAVNICLECIGLG